MMYMIIHTLLSSVLEVRDYLKESRSDVMLITKTKINKGVHISFKEDG